MGIQRKQTNLLKIKLKKHLNNTPNTFCLIDDDEIFLRTAHKLIEAVFGKNTEIHSFLDPYQGIDFLKKNSNCILMLDIMMEPIDGWQVLDELEKWHALPERTYILSSSLQVSDIETASKLPSVDSFIKKPLDKDRLERIQFALH